MFTEKRAIKDRRTKPTSPISYFSLRGNRKSARRSGEDLNYYVDHYETRYLLLLSSILILCILDGYLTFKIIQLGGEELNPFMAGLIWKRPVLSLVLKYLITAGSMVVLITHKNFQIFKIIRIKYVIYLVFTIYFFLILYEIYIFFTLLKH